MINIVNLSLNAMIIIYVVATSILIMLLLSKKLNYKKAKAAFFIFSNFIVSVFIYYCLQNRFNINHLFPTICIGFGLINIMILILLKLYKPFHGILFLFLTAFSISFSYNSYTSYFLRQHDSRQFWDYSWGGHFGYIGYIFQNHHLPTVNPKDYWCFFNPPLFYIVSSKFLELQQHLGLDIEKSFENLQILSMIYMIIFDIYIYRILNRIGLKKSLPIVLSFVFLSPALIIMSGSINNDMFSITLSTMALFYSLKWFETDNLLDLVKIAICIGLAIMTKISSALIAIVIGIIFVIKFIKNKKKWKKYLVHFGIFAIISLPIGLWFPIKNWVKYDIPPTYVQSIDPDTPINLSNYSIFDRFFKIGSTENLTNINVLMTEKKLDFNILFTTIKSFVLDENIEYERNFTLNFTIHTLFYTSIAISIMFVINLIYVIVKYKKIKNNWLLLLLFIFILEISSYLKFCFDFPFPFTMNFRYIIPTLISFAGIVGIASDNNKVLLFINTILLSFFSITSIIMFTNLT